MGKKIFLCVTLDTECDKDENWNICTPLTFKSILNGIPEKLTPLFNKYGIKPTYFLSPEVLQNQECVSFLSQNHLGELGTHLHAEFIEPNADMDASITKSVQAELDQEIEDKKLQNLTQLFISKFKYSPKSFRAGRFGLSKHSLGFLSRLGYMVESSVTPFYCHEFTNGIRSNYWGAPFQPYFPNFRNYRINGSSKILEVPITVINPTLLSWPFWLLRRMDNRSFIHKRLLPRLGIKVERTRWLRPKYSTAEEMISIADWVDESSTRKNFHVLNMMYHTMEIIPGASPYAINEEQVKSHISSQITFFDYLFSHYDVECVEISKLYDLY